MCRELTFPPEEDGGKEMVQDHLSIVSVSGFSLWRTSLSLNLIHEPEDPNMCEHFPNPGIQIVSGKFCLESSVWKAVAKQKLGFPGSGRSYFL